MSDHSLAVRLRAQLRLSTPDVNFIRNIAIHHGLQNHEIRRRAWPLLLGPTRCRPRYGFNVDPCTLKDYDVIKCDINRSLWHIIPTMTQNERLQRRQELMKVIVDTLCMDQTLCYYQGFHDICSVLLLVCGNIVAGMVAQALCRDYIREFLYKDLRYVEELLRLIFHVVRAEDPELADHLQKGNMTEGHYALSWLLTWFAHALDNLEASARLFDFIIATDPLTMPLILSATLVLHSRRKILDTEPDLCSLHGVLTKLPATTYDPAILLPSALALLQKYPPQVLLSSDLRSHPEFEFIGSKTALQNENGIVLRSSSLVKQSSRSAVVPHLWLVASAALSAASMVAHFWLSEESYS